MERDKVIYRPCRNLLLLESIVGSRQNSEKKQTGTNESILSMLLTEMDGVGTAKIHQHSSSTMRSENDDPTTKVSE